MQPSSNDICLQHSFLYPIYCLEHHLYTLATLISTTMLMFWLDLTFLSHQVGQLHTIANWFNKSEGKKSLNLWLWVG